MAQISALPFRSRSRTRSEAEKALLSPRSPTLSYTASSAAEIPLLFPPPTCMMASSADPPLTTYIGTSIRISGERQI